MDNHAPASSPSGSAQSPPGGSSVPAQAGENTRFFLSRVHREINAPLQQFLSSCERLVSQAKAIGKEDLASDFLVIRDAARKLVARITSAKEAEAANLELYALLSRLHLTEAERAAQRPQEVRSLMGNILIVDDDLEIGSLLATLLHHDGHSVTVAGTGAEGLELTQREHFDLVLLDLNLPDIRGYEVLKGLKANLATLHTPVIIISGDVHLDSTIKCIEQGAEDFIAKPPQPVLLRARVLACLEKKRLRDQEQEYLHSLHVEREMAERLLLNVLPQPAAARLKRGDTTIVEERPDVSVIFADLVGFSQMALTLSSVQLVQMLDVVFSIFDHLAQRHGLEKIKTIGDSYMVVGGLVLARPDHLEAAADMALAMVGEIERFNLTHGTSLRLRVGLHTGPVIAGVIGKFKFSYDLWGDTVNLASRMESHGQPDTVQVSPAVEQRLRGKFRLAERGSINIKGVGLMSPFVLLGRHELGKEPT